MNKKQLIALWIGVAVAVLMAIVPPWQRVFHGNLEGAHGYGFIFSPPAGGVVVDISRLGLQWLCVAVITAAAIWTLSTKKA